MRALPPIFPNPLEDARQYDVISAATARHGWIYPLSAIVRASQPVTTRKPHSSSSPNSGTYCFWAPLCPESQRCGLRLGGSDRFELNSSRTGLCHPGKPSATVMLRYLLTNRILRTAPFKATLPNHRKAPTSTIDSISLEPRNPSFSLRTESIFVDYDNAQHNHRTLWRNCTFCCPSLSTLRSGVCGIPLCWQLTKSAAGQTASSTLHTQPP